MIKVGFWFILCEGYFVHLRGLVCLYLLKVGVLIFGVLVEILEGKIPLLLYVFILIIDTKFYLKTFQNNVVKHKTILFQFSIH